MSLQQHHRGGWTGVTFVGLSLVLGLLWVTGFVMLGWSSIDMLEISDSEALLRRSATVAHGVMAWVFCVLCGRGVWPHVQAMSHRHMNRWQSGWGWVNLSVVVLLAVSGLLLLYGSAAVHEFISPGHFWVGALAPMSYVLHAWKRLVRER
jgi:hypothetical protein